MKTTLQFVDSVLRSRYTGLPLYGVNCMADLAIQYMALDALEF
jgi:hypothetical protein